jgi:caspase domain-containing protein
MMYVPRPCAILLALGIGAAFASGTTLAQSNAEPRTALIIGNSAYSFGTLANPANDATDVANALRNAGFDVTLKTDADRRNMQDAVRAFGSTLKQKGGVGLFYFAGHGMQVNGENYVLPLIPGAATDDALKNQAVGASEVVDAMAAARNGLNIVVLDACRDNPLSHGGTRGLSRIDSNASLFVSYSTSPGAVALDGSGRNSPYTKNLVTALSQSDLSIEETFKRTLKGVYQETRGQQTPWISSSFFGDFIFRPTRPVVIPTTDPTGRDALQATPGSPPNLTGVYRVEGANPNGSRYRGMLTLTPFGKDYLFKWWIGRQVFTGSGQFAGRMLVVNWGQKSPVVYTIKRSAGLDGEWADGTATERLDLYARAADDPVREPSGQYRVSGRNPNGQSYSGTVSIANRSGQFVVDWRVGGSNYRGSGTLASNVLTVDWGDSSPVVYAVNANGTLTGLWQAGAGEETLTPDR